MRKLFVVAVKAPWTEVDPVTVRLPVMTALPVNGNVGGAKLEEMENDAVAGVNVILVAALAVVANEAVAGINVMLVAALAVIAFSAQLAVPSRDPVMPAVTFNDPVTIVDPVTINDPVTANPLGKLMNPSIASA